MDPFCDDHGLGVGRLICVNGGRCLVGLGNQEGACECRVGLLGSAITAGYRLVVGVFWHAPRGLGVCGRQSVDNDRIDRHQVIQVDQG